jgi:arabinoxylan arabinofuranohydrolase
MKNHRWKKIVGAILFGILFPFVCYAQNPVVQTIYTADPAPMVHNDTLYLYTGHDEDKSTWFTMKDWHCYSTTDMVNWTDRGVPLSLQSFDWVNKDAWAGQCIFRDGKFYWYVPMNQSNGKGMAIGVAVSDKPTGPFKDALGKPLVSGGWGYIDPTVFMDDDGQAYLYWGNPNLYYVKLNKDMVSYSGDVITVPLNKEGFWIRYKDTDKRPSSYEEGPWLFKRNAQYYLLYPAGGVPEHLAYSTSISPTGPWVYGDTIMPVIKKSGAFTNHPGYVDYKGKSYFFYHNGALPGGGGFTRSVCVEEFTFNADGSIPRIAPTSGIAEAVGNINPFTRVEAETMAWEEGVETATDNKTGVYVTNISNGDYIKVRRVDLEKGAKKFEAITAAISDGGSIKLHLDSLTGFLLGTCLVKKTGGMLNWASQSCKIQKVSGVHDVFLVFEGVDGNLFNFDGWKLK